MSIRPDRMRLFRTLNDHCLKGWSWIVTMRFCDHNYESLKKHLNLDEYSFLCQMREFYKEARKRTRLDEKMPNFFDQISEDLH